MNTGFNQVIKKEFPLIVSLPENRIDMALAAEENGADALKVHLNVEHFASGTRFGSWTEEKNNIIEIIKSVKIPVGILPGAEAAAGFEEIMEAAGEGAAFLDAFAHDLPLSLWGIPQLGYMLAVNLQYDKETVQALTGFGVDAIEATILPHSQYGKELNMQDLALYHRLSRWCSCPVLIPTQKKIRPCDVIHLKKAGAGGIIIGAVVTGKSVESLAQTTRQFRNAVEERKRS